MVGLARELLAWLGSFGGSETYSAGWLAGFSRYVSVLCTFCCAPCLVYWYLAGLGGLLVCLLLVYYEFHFQY